MTEPPQFIQPLLHSIESTTLTVKEEFSTLDDKDVEWVYGKLKDYYKQVGRGKTPKEPDSNIERKGVLIDEILNIIEEREEMDADIDCVNDPDCTNNGVMIPSLGMLYFMGFKRLEESARFWRKNREFGGYLKYISHFVR